MVKLDFRERPRRARPKRIYRSDIAQLSTRSFLPSNLSFLFCINFLPHSFVPMNYLYSLLITCYTHYIYSRVMYIISAAENSMAVVFICERGKDIYIFTIARVFIAGRCDASGIIIRPRMKILGAVNASRAAMVKGKPGTSLSLYSYVRHSNRTGLCLPACEIFRSARERFDAPNAMRNIRTNRT